MGSHQFKFVAQILGSQLHWWCQEHVCNHGVY